MRTIIYSAIYNDFYPFEELAARQQAVKFANQMVELDGYLVLWGGEDISPSLYGEKGVSTYAGDTPSMRDDTETELFKAAIGRGIPVIGICRGAQLACALLGGKLIQHVTDHAGQSHGILTNEGKMLTTNSLHHQMLVPAGNFDILAKAQPARSTAYVTETAILDKHPLGYEPEIVWWPEQKVLAIQGHPEMLPKTHPFVIHCLQLIKDYIG